MAYRFSKSFKNFLVILLAGGSLLCAYAVHSSGGGAVATISVVAVIWTFGLGLAWLLAKVGGNPIYAPRSEYVWEIDLVCPKCQTKSKPSCKGWSPKQIAFGNVATIVAILVCSRCGSSLENEAKRKLKELFGGIKKSPTKKVIWAWVIFVVLIIIVVAWLEFLENKMVAVIVLVIGSFALGIATGANDEGALNECRCGRPLYVFMGFLGRSFCYRCSNCGNLLRLLMLGDNPTVT